MSKEFRSLPNAHKALFLVQALYLGLVDEVSRYIDDGCPYYSVKVYVGPCQTLSVSGQSDPEIAAYAIVEKLSALRLKDSPLVRTARQFLSSRDL